MLKIIALIIVLIGVIFIYDARLLSEKWFGFGDQNQATAGIKILGFIFSIMLVSIRFHQLESRLIQSS